jgi:hypothetical protein
MSSAQVVSLVKLCVECRILPGYEVFLCLIPLILQASAHYLFDFSVMYIDAWSEIHRYVLSGITFLRSLQQVRMRIYPEWFRCFSVVFSIIYSVVSACTDRLGNRLLLGTFFEAAPLLRRANQAPGNAFISVSLCAC